MPIDDIPYLIQHSVKENIIVLIDSSTRDKLAWPTPGEFVIDFPEPFSLVFGIEIIHASIPRTMFMVDNHCNEIIFYCGVWYLVVLLKLRERPESQQCSFLNHPLTFALVTN